jgi:hypothetical protein
VSGRFVACVALRPARATFFPAFLPAFFPAFFPAEGV